MFNAKIEFRKIQNSPPMWRVIFKNNDIAMMELSGKSVYIARLHCGKEVEADDRKEMAAALLKAVNEKQ